MLGKREYAFMILTDIASLLSVSAVPIDTPIEMHDNSSFPKVLPTNTIPLIKLAKIHKFDIPAEFEFSFPFLKIGDIELLLIENFM